MSTLLALIPVPIPTNALQVLSDNGTFMLVSHMAPDSDEFASFSQECLLPAVAAEHQCRGDGGEGGDLGGLEDAAPRRWSMECHVTPGRATVYLVKSSPGRRTRGGGAGGLAVTVHEYADDSDDEVEG